MPSINRMLNYPGMSTATANVLELRTRDSDRTQQAILQAATDDFAERGLAGARIDTIAERAGINKRLIYYYFSSKDELFRAVLELTYARIRDAERALELESVHPAEAVRRLITFTWQYYLDHPEFLTLLNTENLHRAGHLKDAARVRELNSPLVEALGHVLERGRLEGVFRGGVDAVQLYVSIAGLAYFYLSNTHTLSTIFGRDLMAPKARSERLEHMCEVILGYLGAAAAALPRPPPRRTRKPGASPAFR